MLSVTEKAQEQSGDTEIAAGFTYPWLPGDGVMQHEV